MSATHSNNIVKEFKIGNSIVKISDGYCKDTTQEEIDRILRRVATLTYDYFVSIAEKERM